jgi:valyl-tRNA synthetase
MTAEWPVSKKSRTGTASAQFKQVQTSVTAIRNLAAMVRPESITQLDSQWFIVANEPNWEKCLRRNIALIRALTAISTLEVLTTASSEFNLTKLVSQPIFNGQIYWVPPPNFDHSPLCTQWKQQLAKLNAGLVPLQAKLSNQRFLTSADPEVLDSERKRWGEMLSEAVTLSRNLERLTGEHHPVLVSPTSL